MDKAYICMDTYECTGGVIFAKSNIAARKIAANEWNDGELGGLSVRRAPGLDKYSDTKRVPAWELIVKHGWNWEDGCSYCGQSLNYDDLEDAGKDPTKVVGFDGTHVYCDDKCHQSYMAAEKRKNEAGQYFLDEMIRRVKERFGDVDIARTHHYTVERDGCITTEQAIVDFDFPGRKFMHASWRYSKDSYKPCETMMPHTVSLTCSHGDKEVFEQWATSLTPPQRQGGKE